VKLTWGDTSIPQTDVPKHVIASIGRQFQVPYSHIPKLAWRCSDVQAWGCGPSIIPMLGHPQAKPQAWGCGTSIPHSWTSPSSQACLGMWDMGRGKGLFGLAAHCTTLLNEKTQCSAGITKTLNLKPQDWVGIRKWKLTGQRILHKTTTVVLFAGCWLVILWDPRLFHSVFLFWKTRTDGSLIFKLFSGSWIWKLLLK
jgi:hypothetical protein